MKTTITVLALSLMLSAFSHANPGGTSKLVRLADCPAPVREAIGKASAAGKLDKVRMSTVKEDITYHAEIDLPADREVKIKVMPDGTVVQTATVIPLNEVPEAIRKAMASVAAGQGKIEDVEQVVEGSATTWKAEIDRETLPDLEIKLDDSGKLLSREEEPS